MSNGLQYDDDDLEDEEDSELGISDIPPETAPQPQQTRAAVSRPERAESPRRLLRVRPMPKTMEDKYPEVVTCLLTQRDGRQVMLVRK